MSTSFVKKKFLSTSISPSSSTDRHNNIQWIIFLWCESHRVSLGNLKRSFDPFHFPEKFHLCAVQNESGHILYLLLSRKLSQPHIYMQWHPPFYLLSSASNLVAVVIRVLARKQSSKSNYPFMYLVWLIQMSFSLWLTWSPSPKKKVNYPRYRFTIPNTSHHSCVRRHLHGQ